MMGGMSGLPFHLPFPPTPSGLPFALGQQQAAMPGLFPQGMFNGMPPHQAPMDFPGCPRGYGMGAHNLVLPEVSASLLRPHLRRARNRVHETSHCFCRVRGCPVCAMLHPLLSLCAVITSPLLPSKKLSLSRPPPSVLPPSSSLLSPSSPPLSVNPEPAPSTPLLSSAAAAHSGGNRGERSEECGIGSLLHDLDRMLPR
eukprot:2520632-Rhodomonas_salina.1